MKHLLPALALLILSLVLVLQSNAQCAVSNLVVQNVTILNSTPVSCTSKADVTFNIESNNGNKFIFIHVWLQNDYPDYFHCNNGLTTLSGSIKAPKAADLSKSIVTIAINSDGDLPLILTSYPPDSLVKVALMDSIKKIILPDGSTNYTLYGVIAESNVSCFMPQVVVADLWSSQSSNAQQAHCVSCGIRYSAGFLTVAGWTNCITKFYNGSIINNTNIPISGSYEVYADVNNDGYYTPFTDTLLNAEQLFSVGPNATISISGPVPVANLGKNIFIVVTQSTGAAINASRVFVFPSLSCNPAALPVNYLFFSATRTNKLNVKLEWQTTSEMNNSGFSIERNPGNNQWISVAFIPSQALSGSTNNYQSYTHNDTNSYTGNTQYRIRQIDLDGKSKTSEIKLVKGIDKNETILIYPNPAVNGSVNVLFTDLNEKKKVILTDMSGKLLKEWNNSFGNQLLINQLQKGTYLLKVSYVQTGNQTIHKIIVL